jgi:hypothetical protein
MKRYCTHSQVALMVPLPETDWCATLPAISMARRSAAVWDRGVFKVDTSGHETVLYTFTGGADGGDPGLA